VTVSVRRLPIPSNRGPKRIDTLSEARGSPRRCGGLRRPRPSATRTTLRSSPLRSSGAAPARDRSRGAPRRTPALASGRMRELANAAPTSTVGQFRRLHRTGCLNLANPGPEAGQEPAVPSTRYSAQAPPPSAFLSSIGCTPLPHATNTSDIRDLVGGSDGHARIGGAGRSPRWSRDPRPRAGGSW